jgi:hypothetical protein
VLVEVVAPRNAIVASPSNMAGKPAQKNTLVVSNKDSDTFDPM